MAIESKLSIKIPQEQMNGKSVLVTGGTGSFGQKFIERVIEPRTFR